MPENNEKIEDFISLWRKKMENEDTKPSIIAETLDRIKELEKENDELRNKIKENIELLTKTEEIVRNTIEENKNLKEQIGMDSKVNHNESQQKIIEINNKIMDLENKLVEREVELRGKNNEITELKTKLESVSKSIKKADSEVKTKLIEDLKSDIAKKNNQIGELETQINDLKAENAALNQQLIEKMKKLPIDYVVPVEQPEPTVIKPQSTEPSSQTLEILCQDLQTDLNKYKKIVDKLNREKDELEQAFKNGGFQLKPEELKELRVENENLKNEIAEIQESLRISQQSNFSSPKISESEKKINDLESQIKEKDRLIAELKIKQKSQELTPKGPMSDLVEDLQNTINKLKITIEEKNRIIEELKAS
jgi:chromosome segregation ATPase